MCAPQEHSGTLIPSTPSPSHHCCPPDPDPVPEPEPAQRPGLAAPPQGAEHHHPLLGSSSPRQGVQGQLPALTVEADLACIVSLLVAALVLQCWCCDLVPPSFTKPPSLVSPGRSYCWDHCQGLHDHPCVLQAAVTKSAWCTCRAPSPAHHKQTRSTPTATLAAAAQADAQ